MKYVIDKGITSLFCDCYFVSIGESEYSPYLHTDGIVRESTFNPETGKYSGYFTSKEAAEEAFFKWNSLQS